MKTTRALSLYLIRDIAKFSGLSFKHADRLTQAEAQQVAAWARRTPAIAAAYIDKGHPENGAVRLYAGMLEHYMIDHPQTGTAEPAPWPDAKAERALPDNPYGVTTAEEAEAFLAWAQTVPEYRAGFSDDKHPLHADYVKQTQELRELAAPSSPATIDVPPTAVAPVAAGQAALSPAAQAGGLSPARIAELARQDRDGTHLRNRIAELQKNPAYLDGRHPEHAAAVAAVTKAYSAAFPNPVHIPGASASPAPASANRGPAGDRLKTLRENPAYLDAKHPEHAATVAAVTQAYAAAYPEPAPIGAGSVSGDAASV